MLGEHGRSITKTLFTKPALAMAKVGITPNMLTVTGTVLSVVVAVCTLPQGHFLLGVGLLLIVLFGDSFDGILARATGTSSPFGAFLDSCLDRLTDAAVFGSLAVWAALHMPAGTQRTLTVSFAVACVGLGACVSYVRARAESVGADAYKGLAERTDRLIIAGLGALAVGFGLSTWCITVALGVVALAAFITVVQRILAVRSHFAKQAK